MCSLKGLKVAFSDFFDSQSSSCLSKSTELFSVLKESQVSAETDISVTGFGARSQAAISISGHLHLHAEPAEGSRRAGLCWRHHGHVDQHCGAQAR